MNFRYFINFGPNDRALENILDSFMQCGLFYDREHKSPVAYFSLYHEVNKIF